MRTMLKYLRQTSLAFLLLALMAMILVSTFFQQTYITGMSDSSNTIYRDRLLPATDIFHLADHVYKKRLLLERHLLRPDQSDLQDVQYQLGQHDAEIQALIAHVEGTYLVEAENKSLHDLKRKLAVHRAMEAKLLREPAGKNVGFGPEITASFEAVRAELLLLSSIQTTVGQEVVQGSAKIAASADSLNHLQLGSILVVGILIQSILMTTRMPKRVGKPDPALH